MSNSNINNNWRKNLCNINPDEYIKIVSKLNSLEYKIYCEAVQGYVENEISEKLNIDIKSIQVYLKQIYKKLNVSNYKELVLEYGNTFNYVNNVDDGL